MIQARGGFFDRLAMTRDTLSPKMLRVARFMEAQYLDAAFMSTRELAGASGVSLATVVRFPRVLGYASFDALRDALQDQVNVDLTGVERLASLPHANASGTALLRRVIDEDMQTLRALAQNLSQAQLERFVAALQRAERIIVVGFRYVTPLTLYCAYSLNKIKGGVEGYTHADSLLYDHVRLLGGDDVILAIGFARYPADLVKLVAYAHRLDRRILCITDSTLSPLLPLADVCLFAKGTIRDFVGSLAAPGALINCVVSELGRRLGDGALKRLGAAEEAARANGIYAGGDAMPKRGRGWRRTLLHQTGPLQHDPLLQDQTLE